jgi:Fic family protein
MAFVPDPLPPRLEWTGVLGRLTEPLLEAQRQVARLDGMASRLADAAMIARPLRLREATLSSRIENTIATVEEVSLFEAQQAPAREDVVEVSNYDRALEHGLNSPLPISMRLVREMHRVLLRTVRGENMQPGEIRDIQNYIGDEARGFADARFVPPPPGEPLRQCLDEWERFVNRPSEPRLPDLVRVGLAHYQFEAIHPFRDGNGRIGRLLIALSMCRMRLVSEPLLYVSGHFEAHRQRYYDLMLGVSRDGEWEAWLRFFLEAVAVQGADAQRRADRLLRLHKEYVDRVTRARASALLVRLINQLFRHPAVTAKRACKLLQVTHPTAQKHIDTLLRHGILEQVSPGHYGRLYVARGVLRAVESNVHDDGGDHPPT